MKLYANNKTLDLSCPQIMGILNVTPDSFSDSGKFLQSDKALIQVEKMLQEGASIIDIGGESTRPMADEVTVQQELDRVVPIVEMIHQRFDCWISVDTSKPEIMRESAKVGMDIINDIRALQLPNALETAATLNLPVCLMHMQGEPRTMQSAPHYDNLLQEVMDFLLQRSNTCLQAGIAPHNIIWDLGFGFGKTLEHNFKLLQQQALFSAQGYPILTGVSRKSMIGLTLDKPVDQRAVGSAAAALLAVQNGASIVRVHDVGVTADVLKIWQAMITA
ncbi:MAG: dihydropteroate synthase [Pasteurellaceae bacterium]|nr:dihydropteroate synthase [Pasteurellaceae bacterium]